MTTTEIQQALVSLGWPLTVDGVYGPQSQQAVRDFQQGWAFYPLTVDGVVGPHTSGAIATATQNGGYASRHFRYVEFKSKGDGWIKVFADLLHGLDRYRDQHGPTVIVSGYRDPAYNASVGGAADSQHLYGAAADLTPLATLGDVRSLGAFSGIGIERSNGLIRHVDVRHVSGYNATGGSPANPTVWYYG